MASENVVELNWFKKFLVILNKNFWQSCLRTLLIKSKIQQGEIGESLGLEGTPGGKYRRTRRAFKDCFFLIPLTFKIFSSWVGISPTSSSSGVAEGILALPRHMALEMSSASLIPSISFTAWNHASLNRDGHLSTKNWFGSVYGSCWAPNSTQTEMALDELNQFGTFRILMNAPSPSLKVAELADSPLPVYQVWWRLDLKFQVPQESVSGQMLGADLGLYEMDPLSVRHQTCSGPTQDFPLYALQITVCVDWGGGRVWVTTFQRKYPRKVLFVGNIKCGFWTTE